MSVNLLQLNFDTMNTLRTLSSLLLMSVLGCCLPVLGQNRSAAEAEQIANTFLSQPRRAPSLGTVPMLQPTMHLYATSSELLDKGTVEPAF